MLPHESPVQSVQAQVLANLRGEPIGGHSVADLGIPDAFLRRVADRIIRNSFEGRFRVVFAKSPPVDPAAGPEREVRPELRGYRPGGIGETPLPMDLKPEELSPGAQEAAGVVARRLATDGLLLTTARAIEAIGLERFVRPGRNEVEVLARIGLPVDLLPGYCMTEGRKRATESIWTIAALLKRHGSAEKCKREFSKVPFIRSTCPGFRALADSGQEPIRRVRIQVTSDSYWLAQGDGGCLDMVRQFMAEAPEADIIASVERKHEAGFAAKAQAWQVGRKGTLRIVAEELSISQWAQDNGKAGRDADGAPLLMLPRYASRGEVGAALAPGEVGVSEGLARAGVRCVRSPLHFQGGNVLMAEDSRTRERTLLIGEAEIWRNTALGLSPAHAEAGLGMEFGADRTVVLPAASFHTDFEVSVCATESGLVALVNDAQAAARIIVECGIGVLHRNGLLAEHGAHEAVEHLRAGRSRQGLALAGPALAGAAIGPGRYSESFADLFSAGPADHGPSNLYRVLLAMDLLSAATLAPGQWPRDGVGAYLETFTRQEGDRRMLHRRLRDAGMRVVAVPSLAEPHRGANSLNGLHEPGRYLMPAYGGLLAPLDAAAGAIIARTLGVAVVPIECAESQRRSGALRCAVSVMA